MSDLNAFEAYAEDVKPRWERRAERIKAKRRETRVSKMIEQSKLEKIYLALSAEHRKELLANPLYGFEFGSFIRYLEGLTLADGHALLGFIARMTWLRHAPAPVRQEALILISRAIMRLRERHGMTPFDDGLPWEPPTVFVRIREILEESHAEGGDAGLCGGDAEGLEARPGPDDRRQRDRPMRASDVVPEARDAA